jgi:hypothetical protein
MIQGGEPMRDGDQGREDDDDRSIRFLLSGGRLSGADHDRIIERLRRRPDQPKPSRWWLLGLGTTLAGAVGALVMVIGMGRQGAGGDGFTAKGQAPAGPMLEARCPGRPRGSCRVGDKLIFEVEGATEGGFLAAYAERPSGDKVWYFPTREGHLPPVPASAGATVLGEAARIGEEHPPGRYTVHLFVLGQPADRAALGAGKLVPRAEASFYMQVEP